VRDVINKCWSQSIFRDANYQSSALWLHPVKAAGFIDDSSLGGNLFYWQRQRDRKAGDRSFVRDCAERNNTKIKQLRLNTDN
jgi:hypothetical protein